MITNKLMNFNKRTTILLIFMCLQFESYELSQYHGEIEFSKIKSTRFRRKRDEIDIIEQDYNSTDQLDSSTVKDQDNSFENVKSPLKARNTKSSRHIEVSKNDESFADLKNDQEQFKNLSRPWLKTDKDTVRMNQMAELKVVDELKHATTPRAKKYRKLAIDLVLLPGCGKGVGDEGEEGVKTRIVNGADVNEGAYPWMAVIISGSVPYCSATILNPKWILTAAHCFTKNEDLGKFKVKVGSVNWKKGRTYKMSKLILHERYNFDGNENSDIALIKMRNTIVLEDGVSGICLQNRLYEEPPSKRHIHNVTNSFTVVGWGRLKYKKHKYPDIMQEVTLDDYGLVKCMRYWKGDTIIYNSQICLFDKSGKGKDACQGDSGSAAMYLKDNIWYQAGIVSFGEKCGEKVPAVYTKVSYFLDWIIKTIENN